MTAFYLYRLNLSATPFRNRRLFWAGLATAFVLLVTATLVTVQRYTRLVADEQRYLELRDASRLRLEREQAQLAKVTAQAAAGRQPTPEQARAMREALNLLEKRRLSWSRLLLQMEQQLPADIRIMQLAFTAERTSPAAGDQAPAEKNDTLPPPTPLSEIPFTVTVRAPKPEAVTAFIRACDERGIFYFDPNTQAKPADARTPSGKQEVEFTLRGRYRPDGMGNAPATLASSEVMR